MIIREPVVAGQFYPRASEPCRAQLTEMLSATPPVDPDDRPMIGGLVPHAGWACSGAVTAKVFRALADSGTPDVVILLGGVHRYRGRNAALFGTGRWESPLGPVTVDERLAERVLGHTNLIVDDPYAHEDEHSIEVQIPFVKHLFGNARIVPIMVPPIETAHEVGEAVARTIKSYSYNAIVVGTTDLTHYGPRYGFTGHGIGKNANAWAKEINDRRFIDLVCEMKSTEVVVEAQEHNNACSAGAAAATLGAVLGLGAIRAELLEHTTSSEVLADTTPDPATDSVGYAGIVFS